MTGRFITPVLASVLIFAFSAAAQAGEDSASISSRSDRQVAPNSVSSLGLSQFGGSHSALELPSTQRLNDGLYLIAIGAPEKALPKIEQAAALKHPDALRLLGVLHARGIGVTADAKRAIGYFEEAAKLGDAGSMFALAVAYHLGSGVPADDSVADQWFNRAAKAGDYQMKAAVEEYRAAMR
jgi:TPR repeat protein